MVDDERWCAALNADEPLPGSAPVADAHVFIEHLGPWPSSPLEALELDYVAELDLLDASVALVRRPAPARHGATGLPEKPTIIISTAGRVAVTRATGLPSPAALDAALTSLREGEPLPGWSSLPWLILVCTHARRDACCARLGRPLVDDLLGVVDEERVWETTHLGGHRFAPTCLALPSQVIYGRVTSDRVAELADAVARGEVVPDLMRGRTSYSPAVQAAEVAARTQLDGRDDTLELVGWSTEGDRTTTTWRRAGAITEVVIETRQGRERQLSCSKTTLETRPVYEAV
ncbi:MAG TPA: sucrase/ferredoxin-like family protein [Propionibacteriaceae bacterium]|nr:sucrase/ferredoxin-like family protein [Propionibacteriaceae bacterium]